MTRGWAQCIESNTPTICRQQGNPSPLYCQPEEDVFCTYCNNVYTPAHKPCVYNDDYGNDSRCSGRGAPPSFHPGLAPSFCVGYAAGSCEADGATEAFWTVTNLIGFGMFRYILGRQVTYLIDRCAPGVYCPIPNPSDGHWLCRMLIHGQNHGWQLLCNQILPGGNYDEPWLDPVELTLNLDRQLYRLCTVFLVMGDKPYCFGPYQSHYCFTEVCDEPENNNECVGSLARNLDWVYVDLDARLSTDQEIYPREQPGGGALPDDPTEVIPWDTVLKNAVLGTYCRREIPGSGLHYCDRIETPGHDARLLYSHKNQTIWRHVQEFDGSDPSHDVAYPFVRGSSEGGGPYHDEYSGDPIPITLRAAIAGVEFPGWLTLWKHSILLNMQVERHASGGDSLGYRVFAEINFWVRCRIKLDFAAYAVDWTQSFLNASDRFDLRIDDPDNPGSEHPYERLVAFGPNGERVPRVVTWYGLRSHRRFSRVPNTMGIGLDYEAVADDSPACCGLLYAIDGLVINGALDDMAELQSSGAAVELEQRHQGAAVITLSTPPEQIGACW
jgi:hypothetical protein